MVFLNKEKGEKMEKRDLRILSMYVIAIILAMAILFRYKIVGHQGAYIYRYDRWTGRSSVVFFEKTYNKQGELLE